MSDPNDIQLEAQGEIRLGGDVIGRDKIITNVQNIVQRALTAAEEAAHDRALEQQALAQGVSALAARLRAIAADDQPLAGGPYKGLPAFDLSDCEWFSGRLAAIAEVLERLERGPFTVLHAEAGAGKTSLLQAGLSPYLIAAGHLPVYLRAQTTHPGFLVKRAFLADPGQAPLLATASLHDFLRQVGDVVGADTTLYLLIDQVEKLFTDVDEGGRAEFTADLAECLADASLNVRWLLAIRSDSVERLTSLQPQIQNPLANESHFGNLSRSQAITALVEPARRAGLTFEAGLAEAIVADLGGHDIPPSQVQLVGAALYESLPAGARTPPYSGAFTRAAYEAAGRATGILQHQRRTVLDQRLPPLLRLLAEEVLKALEAEPLQSVSGLLERLRAAPPPRTQSVRPLQPMTLTPPAIAAVLDELEAGRLVRVIAPEVAAGRSETTYAAAHSFRWPADSAPEPPALTVAEVEARVPKPRRVTQPLPPVVTRAAPLPLPTVLTDLAQEGTPTAPLPAALPTVTEETVGAISLAATGDLTIAGDVVGRDKIINHIQNIYQRALTAAEAAASDREIERRALAQGIGAYARRLQAIAAEGADGSRAGSPYKGLLAYRLSDAEIFYGRSGAISSVLHRLERGPLTVLHSESGAGKSSLIQAGIMPRLITAGCLPVFLRPYNASPVQVVKRAFLADPSVAPQLAAAPLREFLRQANDILGASVTVYLILDQAEELFTQLADSARAQFVAELAECLDDESLNVRWLLALRTEFFGHLANFRPQVRNPYDNDFRLNRLTHAEAAEVVSEPAGRLGLSFEAGLIEAILQDLGQDNLPPPQLQLVCSGLYDELPAGATRFTRAQYDRLGRAPGILHSHLARVMGRNLAPAQRPIAQHVFEALITSQGRRAVRTRGELLDELSAGKLSTVNADSLTAVLNQLVDSRLLVVHQSEAGQAGPTTYELASGLTPQMVAGLAYELAHDYLLDQIRLDPEVQARKAAQELLEQEVRTYQQYKTLLTPERLAVIKPHLGGLRLTPAAEKLLAESQAEIEREEREAEARRQKELEDARKLAESERKRAEEQAQANRRMRTRNRIITVVGLIAAAAAVVAILLGIQSNNNAIRAEREAQVSLAGALASQALGLPATQLDLALLLAAQAYQTYPDDGAGSTVSLENASSLFSVLEKTPRLKHFLRGHTVRLSALALSPTGEVLASGGQDGSLRLWDLKTGQLLGELLPGHSGAIRGLAFSPDGAWLYSADDAGQRLNQWDIASGQSLNTHSLADSATSLTLSSQGLLAVGLFSGNIQLLAGETLEPQGELKGEDEGSIISLAFSPDGQRLVSGSFFGTIAGWNVETATLLWEPVKRIVPISALAFDPEGDVFVAGDWTPATTLWEADTGRLIDTSPLDTRSRILAARFLSGGELMYASADNALTYWTFKTETGIGFVEQPLLEFEGPIDATAISADGAIFVSSSGNTILVWSGESLSVQLPFGWTETTDRQLFSVAAAQDLVAVGDGEGQISLWRWDGQSLASVGGSVIAHDGLVYDLAFSPDGQRLASVGSDGVVRLWTAQGEPVFTLGATGEPNTRHVAFSPDGKRVAAASADGVVRLWETSTGNLQLEIPTPDAAWGVAFQPPDGGLLAVTDSFNVSLYDAASGALTAGPWRGHDDIVWSAAFSPDGRLLASASRDTTIRLWDVAEGLNLGEFVGHTHGIQGIVFLPGGLTLASASADGTIRLWDVASFQPIGAPFRSHAGSEAYRLAVGPNGDWLISVGADGRINVRQLDPHVLLAQACEIAGRNLTLAEWAAYLPPEEPYRPTCAQWPPGP